ncbi:NAD(P)H-dependent oxidoreductase [Verrucomicrobium sp. BvORR106]|uniref:flavodoxin family protein n=1 Tax=Verrucomicrobium sp. BvORR106 TaxID=1403819 RepID=UPI0009DE3CF8|nr:NAD(P)H-dependent oxidoreductase [Verrucomicrobium sp. BvORR106]
MNTELTSSSTLRTSVAAPALAILGSARSEGNTARALQRLFESLPCEVVDLNQVRIAPFSYSQQYSDDDFIGIIEQMVEAPLIVFATPVYWYSYSAPMKQFIDRFTDLLYSRKDLGRRLRGRKVAFLTTGYAPRPNEVIQAAFGSFCDYLGLEQVGMVYAQEGTVFYDEVPVEAVRECCKALANDS